MENEVWKPILGANGYEVSDQGRVRNKDTGRVLRPGRFGRGYLNVRLRWGQVYRTATVHSLVAAAFLGPRPPGMDVVHLNGVPDDNREENLCYESRSDNVRRYRVRNGTAATPPAPGPVWTVDVDPTGTLDVSVPALDDLP